MIRKKRIEQDIYFYARRKDSESLREIIDSAKASLREIESLEKALRDEKISMAQKEIIKEATKKPRRATNKKESK